jgi:small-conductance mechanosensitive channel
VRELPHLQGYFQESVATIVVLVLAVMLRVFATRLVKHYSKISEILEHRSNLVIKYSNIFITSLVIITLFIIWGVRTEYIVTTFSAAVTVIGVAFFAQWSVLSNITSGIILLFSFPFKIGDTIRIHDKDFPIEGEIEDIRTFHTLLRTRDGEIITYPNNLLLQKGISIVRVEYDDREFTD